MWANPPCLTAGQWPGGERKLSFAPSSPTWVLISLGQARIHGPTQRIIPTQMTFVDIAGLVEGAPNCCFENECHRPRRSLL